MSKIKYPYLGPINKVHGGNNLIYIKTTYKDNKDILYHLTNKTTTLVYEEYLSGRHNNKSLEFLHPDNYKIAKLNIRYVEYFYPELCV